MPNQFPDKHINELREQIRQDRLDNPKDPELFSSERGCTFYPRRQIEGIDVAIPVFYYNYNVLLDTNEQIREYVEAKADEILRFHMDQYRTKPKTCLQKNRNIFGF